MDRVHGPHPLCARRPFNDICQNAYGMGLFTGGLGFHQGATRIGAAVIPISSGQTERQIMILQDFGVTVLCCTPTYALTIAERAEEMGVKIRDLPLRIGCFGAEPWTIEMRKEIEHRLGIKAMETYGLTEFGGPGTAFDCIEQNGLHINEDHFIRKLSIRSPETSFRWARKGNWSSRPFSGRPCR